jgi:exodeoxyribonuclease VII small subunit
MEARQEEKMRFEDYLEQVEKAVRDLESGQLGLEESLKRYEEGIKALKRCYEILKKAEQKIEIITRNEQGNIITQPFDFQKTFEGEVGADG